VALVGRGDPWPDRVGPFWAPARCSALDSITLVVPPEAITLDLTRTIDPTLFFVSEAFFSGPA
jgi:hypothetical protein